MINDIIDKVIEQILIDIKKEDFTAIEELLKVIPVNNLKSYLSEDILK